MTAIYHIFITSYWYVTENSAVYEIFYYLFHVTYLYNEILFTYMYIGTNKRNKNKDKTVTVITVDRHKA